MRMKKQYDFSKGERGRFFRGKKPLQIVVNVTEADSHSRFEVYLAEDGMYRFRLKNDETILFVSESEYSSKDACLDAISKLKQNSLLAPTVFA